MDQTSEDAATTTPRGGISAPTRREMLTSLGALAIGIAWGDRSSGFPAGLADLVGRKRRRPSIFGRRDISAPDDWHDRRIEALVPGCSMLWTETNQIFSGDRNELVARNGIDSATPLMARLSADDRARLRKAAMLCKVPMASLVNFRP
jgi:hypothetical protein